MTKKSVYIKTFGCQMNERDSLAMEALLCNEGYTVANEPQDADLILFNTCTIRDKAYQKAMSDIGRAVDFKCRPGVKIGVCGCAAQQSKGHFLRRFQHIDFVLGPDQIAQLPTVIDSVEQGHQSQKTDLVDDPGTYVFVGGALETRIQNGSAFVTIMKGCNYACSYCIVPSVRGREVCRSAEEILTEIRSHVSRGAKEVTLLGQNVADYKAFVDGTKKKLGWLVRSIAEATTVQRIRFTSPHPRDIDEDLIAAYRDCQKLCRHIHLPVQAGNNRVLKCMRRGYTREHYLELIEKLRHASPEIAVTTDIIVGFPTETEEEFEETLQLVKTVEYDNIFAFAYSPRPGTFAAMNLADDVGEKEKHDRLQRLLSLQREITRRKNEACVGKTSEVLVMEVQSDGRGSGRNPENRLVHFSGGKLGEIVTVQITRALGNSLEGVRLS